MRSDSAQVLNTTLIFPDELKSAIGKQGQDLTALETQAVGSLGSLWLGHFENSHHLYLLELLPQEQWESDKTLMTETLRRQDLLRSQWIRSRATYRESFAKEMDAIVQKIEAEE